MSSCMVVHVRVSTLQAINTLRRAEKRIIQRRCTRERLHRSDKENRRRTYALSTLQGTARPRNLRSAQRRNRPPVPGHTMHQLRVYRGLRDSRQSPPPSCGTTVGASRDGWERRRPVMIRTKKRRDVRWEGLSIVNMDFLTACAGSLDALLLTGRARHGYSYPYQWADLLLHR